MVDIRTCCLRPPAGIKIRSEANLGILSPSTTGDIRTQNFAWKYFPCEDIVQKWKIPLNKLVDYAAVMLCISYQHESPTPRGSDATVLHHVPYMARWLYCRPIPSSGLPTHAPRLVLVVSVQGRPCRAPQSPGLSRGSQQVSEVLAQSSQEDGTAPLRELFAMLSLVR